MNPPDIAEIQRRYSAMSDEEFARIRRDDLTTDGQTAYDLEAQHRGGSDWTATRAQANAEYEKEKTREARRQRRRVSLMDSFSGIEGWLVLPALGLLVGPIGLAVGIVRSWSLFDPSMAGFEHEFPGLRAFAIGQLLTRVVWLVATVYVAVEFFRRRRTVPFLMVLFLTINAGLAILLRVWLASVVGSSHPQVAEHSLAVVGTVITATIWIPYFLTSKRVRKTFWPPNKGMEPTR